MYLSTLIVFSIQYLNILYNFYLQLFYIFSVVFNIKIQFMGLVPITGSDIRNLVDIVANTYIKQKKIPYSTETCYKL